MIRDLLALFTEKIDPEVYRLRNISIHFFIVWIVDVFLSISCECLILNVNAFVVFNIWVSIAAAALSLHYNHDSSALPSMLTRGANVPRETNPSVLSTCIHQQQGISRSGAESSPRFYFGFRRLHVLISFGSTIFVMFSTLTVVGESLQHAFHLHDTSPTILFLVGGFHIVMFSIYGKEIDAYDRISGSDFRQHDEFLFPSGKTCFLPFRLLRRLERRSNSFVRQNAVFRSAIRAFSPVSCVLLCLAVLLCESCLCEVVGSLLLSLYVFVVAFRRAKEIGWMLVNNAVKHPSVTAQCDHAIHRVKLVNGVLQVRSSIFWEVSEGQLMALLKLRLMTSADPAAVTLAVRRILEGVATFVFVEALTPHEDDNACCSVLEMEEAEHLCLGHDHSHNDHHHNDHDHHHHFHHDHGVSEGFHDGHNGEKI